MTKIAIIGFGNHVQKNILPALNRMNGVEIEAVYVRDNDKYRELASQFSVPLKNIDENLTAGVEWVYISTPISTHFGLASKYIELEKNVICEKPLTESPARSKALFDLAKQNGVKLHEVCMYKYHKQFSHLQETINKNLDSLKSVKAKFTIPHLSKADIRYKKELCGGALLDVGYYPISLIFTLFGEPKEIKSTKFLEKGYEVDLTGIAVFVYDEFYCVAEWGIGVLYTNEIVINTNDSAYKYSRIFSKPETLETTVEITKGLDVFEEKIGADDQFVNMFTFFISSTEFNDTAKDLSVIMEVV